MKPTEKKIKWKPTIHFKLNGNESNTNWKSLYFIFVQNLKCENFIFFSASVNLFCLHFYLWFGCVSYFWDGRHFCIFLKISVFHCSTNLNDIHAHERVFSNDDVFFPIFFLNPLNAWMRTKLYSSYIRHLQIISPNRTHNLSQSRGGAKYKSINFQILTIGCDPFFSSTKFTQIRSTNPNLASKANDKSCAKLVCQRKKKNQWHTQNFNENNDEQKENIGDAFYF